METKILLNKLVDGQDLTEKDASILLEKIIKQELNPTQAAAVLVALRTKGESVYEVLGFIQAMRRHMVKVSAPKALDIVGTGGDGSGTFNVSTAAALVVAGVGIPVAKHGNRAASSKCGSADCLEALGVNINLTAREAEKVFQKAGIVFLFAPNFHPAMKVIGPVRKELGLRTIFNFLGPFLNPAQTKRQLLGVTDINTAAKLAKVAQKLNYSHLMLISGEDNMDEITTTGKTKVFEVKGSRIKSYTLSPQKFGLKKVEKKDLSGGDAKENAKIIKSILKGEKGPKRDIVILNSAAALFVAGLAKGIKEGIKLAEGSIDSGKALKVLEDLVKETQKYA